MRRPARRPLLLALLLSVALHAIGLVTMRIPEGQAIAPAAEAIEVALLRAEPRQPAELRAPAEPARPQQMVAPPDAINDRAPDQARFESDRDNTVLQETVRPGVPNPGPLAPPGKSVAQPPQPPAAVAERADGNDATGARRERARSGHTPALEDLFASTNELVRAQRSEHERDEHAQAAEEPGSGRRRVALAVPPVVPEWTLPGTRGTLDYLPDIQRGNVTLLNTKASVFAPFVRRIGERVFQHLIIRQRSLELQQILSARGPVQMRVLLDSRGKLKSLSVEDHSGSASMDDTLTDALNTGAFDNNPPPAAANPDGNYEFMFQAQLRTFAPGEGGLPNRIESRLSVGLL